MSTQTLVNTNIHGNIIHNNQKVEATQMPINTWMGKQNMVYPYNGILFSHKKEWGTDTGYNRDEPQNHYAKWNKPDIKDQILYDSTYMKYLA